MKSSPIKLGTAVILVATAVSGVAFAGGLCAKKGLTWGFYYTNSTTGTSAVWCHSPLAGILHRGEATDCDPYNGDTKCRVAKPLLCINKDTVYPRPTDVDDTNMYDKWSEGVIGTTKPVQPCTAATTLTQANQICQAEFGAGWRVAEFHDGVGGLGWGLQAYGALGDPKHRVWVDINDKSTTCWDRTK